MFSSIISLQEWFLWLKSIYIAVHLTVATWGTSNQTEQNKKNSDRWRQTQLQSEKRQICSNWLTKCSDPMAEETFG